MQITPKKEEKIEVPKDFTKEDLLYVIEDLTGQMAEAASKLDFEKAALYRDKIRELENLVESR
ncbi:MAG: UvrB/UvrC motif-containing protein, partial [Candidatus Heimdallarchaeaceae archaeon]